MTRVSSTEDVLPAPPDRTGDVSPVFGGAMFGSTGLVRPFSSWPFANECIGVGQCGEEDTGSRRLRSSTKHSFVLIRGQILLPRVHPSAMVVRLSLQEKTDPSLTSNDDACDARAPSVRRPRLH